MNEATQPRQTERFEALDGMRAVAMLSVFGYHFGLPLRPVLAWGGLGYRIIPNLDLGVEVFFVLSGFLIFRPFAAANLTGATRPALRNYAIRRALRVYPAYWVAFISLYLFGEIEMHGGARQFVAHLLLVHQYLPERLQTLFDGLGPSWSLVVEVSFYVLVPILAWLLRRSSVVTHLVVLGMLTVASLGVRIVTVAHPGHGWVKAALGVLPMNLAALAPGMMLAVVSLCDVPQLRRAARRVGVWWLAAAGGFGLLMVFAATSPTSSLRNAVTHPEVEYWHRLMGPVVGVLLVTPVVFGADLRGVVMRVLRSRLVVWLGMVSFGAYLWHQPLLLDTKGDHVALRQSVMDRHSVAYAAVIGAFVLGLTLVAASASWYGIERPAQRLAQRLTRRTRPSHS